MIRIEVENQHVVDKLNQLGKLAPRAARDAINATAVTSRMMLLRAAQGRYTVKSTGFKSDATITKATTGSLIAWIRSKGTPLPATSYHTSTPKSGAKEEVLQGSGLKALTKGNIKAFVNKVGSGNRHVEASRTRKSTGARSTSVYDKTSKRSSMILQREGQDRYPLKAIKSPSVPKQLEMVYKGASGTKAIKTEMNAILRKNVANQLKRYI